MTTHIDRNVARLALALTLLAALWSAQPALAEHPDARAPRPAEIGAVRGQSAEHLIRAGNGLELLREMAERTPGERSDSREGDDTSGPPADPGLPGLAAARDPEHPWCAIPAGREVLPYYPTGPPLSS